MFQKIAKHRANDASNDVHRPPLIPDTRIPQFMQPWCWLRWSTSRWCKCLQHLWWSCAVVNISIIVVNNIDDDRSVLIMMLTRMIMVLMMLTRMIMMIMMLTAMILRGGQWPGASVAPPAPPHLAHVSQQHFSKISFAFLKFHFVKSFIRQGFLEIAITQLSITWERIDTTEKSFIFAIDQVCKANLL